MQDFRTLQVWQLSHKLTLAVYEITANYSKDELFALVSQMRRSSSSIPTNIAEGCGRRTADDFAHFLVIALGSTSEIEYQILLSADLGYISRDKENELNKLANEVKRMLIGLIQKIKSQAIDVKK